MFMIRFGQQTYVCLINVEGWMLKETPFNYPMWLQKIDLTGPGSYSYDLLVLLHI